ncbi:FAD-binding domain-containing protein [Teratosphaeria nubilosa]|uniref:FAD-binding domain-containing protein n=1 Tax=Teratosphaeria nubilosa TaxID=161662 RepID=A0A6G1LFN4_9PEZI|nr:FAD-binding domain-containing protein [Teratosphaeria nubilosa]
MRAISSLTHLCCASSILLPFASAKTAWQQRTYEAVVPSKPVTAFHVANYTTKADALAALVAALGNSSSIVYPGDLNYGLTNARVWPAQRKEHPDAIVSPRTPEEVSIVMQFYSGVKDLWHDGFAVMGGGHGNHGGAQSPSVIIDLVHISETSIVYQPPVASDNISSTDYAILKLGGGAEAGSVYEALDDSGWAFLGPRAASIGVGGFLLGGGIAFQTNKYGVGNDNLLGLEVVLPDGTLVYANANNSYSDLFWAATGGGWLGFGVVTHFYVQAYPDPGDVYVGTIAWSEDKAADVFSKTAAWWASNTDPDAFPALLYYLKDPTDLAALVPLRNRRFSLQLNALYYGGSWAKFNATFGTFFEHADQIIFTKYNLRSLDQYLLTNYPYGYHRLFYGKSHTKSTPEFYNNTFSIYKETVKGMIARGEDPGHTLWVDEYVFPNWNGVGPEKDTDTAWPHSTSAHITLTSGEWTLDSTTEYLDSRDKEMMGYLRDFQTGLNDPPIYDYPNYIAPYSVTEEVWSAENFKRLLEIKEKYDPECLFSRGRVPATSACVEKGFANTFLSS